jgi:heme/copper-type cytochrome/quinol oxidase subunit 3
MTQKTLDVSELPPFSISADAPLWWGQFWMGIIECTLFAMMIAMYFYVRLSVDMWPLPGDQLPHTLLPTIALAPLALSVVASWWASEGAKQNRRGAMIGGLVLNLLLAGLFLALRIVEWHSFNFEWKADIFGSIVWTILGLHTADMVGDMGFTLVLICIIISGRYAEMQRLGVHVDSIVWYLLAGAWFPMYVIIYWGASLFGGT